MPFSSVSQRRTADQGVLTRADLTSDREAALAAAAATGQTLMDDRPLGLAEGESVTYWRRLPHGVQAKVISAAVDVTLDRHGRPNLARLDMGEYVMSVVAFGIVDWVLFDEAGLPVKWDVRQARVLIDGLPDDVLSALGDRIKADAPPDLTAIDRDTADPATGEGPTVGETSADPS